MSQVSVEELSNSYELKLIKKVVKSEYNWVIELLPPDERDLNNYNSIFLNIVIDPYKLAKELGVAVMKYMVRAINGDRPLMYNPKDEYPYNSSTLGNIVDVTISHGIEIERGMKDVINGVVNSNAIPSELLLNHDRTYGISQWLIPNKKTLPIPKDIDMVDG